MSGLAVGQELGGYRLEAVAGRGGMGVVYRARQIRLDRVVALKVIAPELAADEEFRERFQREARLLAAVEHPHVIPVYEADEADGELFLSMRWVDGGDLRTEIALSGGLDPDRAQRLLAQIADALDAVHARGLVHGDIKPANALLESREGTEHAYLSDFGAGRGVETTAPGQWLGTVEYVAPETIQGTAPDPRSDRYALACVAFEALTGAPPFHRDTPWATLWAHANEPPPSARERRPALPAAVDAVLGRGLAKDPEARYASARRLLEALADALLAGRGPSTSVVPTTAEALQAPVPVAPGPPQRQTGHDGKRWRWAALGALLLAACVAAAVIIATSGSSPPPRAAPVAATIARTPLGPGSEPIRVAADDTNGYVLDTFCQCVDITSGGSDLNRVRLPAAPINLVVDSARKLLWVGLSSQRIVAIDLSRQPPVLEPGAVAVPIRPDLLAVLGGRVIVEQKNPAELVRVDARSRQVVGGTVTPGGVASALVTDNDGVLTSLVFPVRLAQFNANLQRTSEHTVPIAVPGGMALDSSGYLWMADYDAGRVWRVNPSTGARAGQSVAVGQDPVSVAVSGDHVWVVNAGDRTVTMINEQAAQVRGVTVPIKGQVGVIAGSPDNSLGLAWMPSGAVLLSLTPKS
jgi:tRNA A-37 threonylcarbamoyl transferase component Bud32